MKPSWFKWGWVGFLALGFLVLMNGLVWYAVWQESPAAARVVFLKVGQGDAILIEGARGNQMLIDGGRGAAILRELSAVMPFYDRSIDLLLPTHFDADHLGGLPEVLQRYRVGAVVQTDAPAETALAQEWQERVTAAGLPVVPARRGLVVWLEPELSVRILFPDRPVAGIESNAGSVVVELAYHRLDNPPAKIILTGDAPQSIERYLTALEGERLRAAVLKVGHHGSRTSTAAAFLAMVRPEYAVISAGAGNRYGHPHAEVVASLVAAGAEVLETAKNGRIEFRSGDDGWELNE